MTTQTSIDTDPSFELWYRLVQIGAEVVAIHQSTETMVFQNPDGSMIEADLMTGLGHVL